MILKRNTTLLALVVITLLPACQPAVTPTNAPSEATSVTPSAESGNPAIQITGDLTASVEADNFYVAPVKGNDESVIGSMLYFNQEDTRIVFIRFPKDAQPGTYPITQGFVTENFDGTSATGNYIDQTSDPAMQFAANGGTLTLISTGESFSGTFEFTAQDDSGNSITVTGAFANITP